MKKTHFKEEAMKKYTFVFAIVAMVAMVTGCGLTSGEGKGGNPYPGAGNGGGNGNGGNNGGVVPTTDGACSTDADCAKEGFLAKCADGGCVYTKPGVTKLLQVTVDAYPEGVDIGQYAQFGNGRIKGLSCAPNQVCKFTTDPIAGSVTLEWESRWSQATSLSRKEFLAKAPNAGAVRVNDDGSVNIGEWYHACILPLGQFPYGFAWDGACGCDTDADCPAGYGPCHTEQWDDNPKVGVCRPSL